MVSAYGNLKNIRTAMNHGAFDFVTKPIDFKDLETTIKKAIKKVALQKLAVETREKLSAISRGFTKAIAQKGYAPADCLPLPPLLLLRY